MAYENFMGNKDFHPSSFRNLKKMYEAEQRQKQEERRQEELRLQYLKEQELYKSKELMGKANPLNFMYEPPPGFSTKEVKGGGSGDSKLQEGEEPKLKFDWQKAGRSAPREEYAKDMELRDRPFGIEVRNVKCIKCGKWGHINTDRVCPLYGKAKPAPAGGGGESATPLPAPLPDLDTMEDGLIFKQCVKDRVVDDMADNQQIILSDDEETKIGELLSGLSKRERKRVLRKLAKSGGGGEGRERKEKTKHRKKKKRLKKEHSGQTRKGRSESDSESEDDDRKRKRKKYHKMKKQGSKKNSHGQRSTDESGSESGPENDRERKKKRKMKQSGHVKSSSESDSTSDSEVEREKRQKYQKRDDSERQYCRGHHGSKVKNWSSHYERGRTRYDKDREISRRHHHNDHSSSEDNHYSHNRSKNSHRRT